MGWHLWGMHSLAEFLFPAPARRTTGAIISWWEKRRLAYNVAVGAAGTISMVAITIVASVEQGRFFVPWQGAVAFGVLANVCYLLGPAAELLIHKLWGRTMLPTGPALFRMGLTFSVGLAFLPVLLLTIVGVATVVAGAFF